MTLTEPTAAPPVQDVPVGKPFNVLLCVEGVETSDNRLFELGSSTWRQLPIPFMVQNTAPHGPGQLPDPAWSAGQIDEWIQRDPGDPTRILGRGHLLPTEEGARAEALARGGFRGVSVDAYLTGILGPGYQPTHVDQNGKPIAILTRYDDNVIARCTMVPTPAIEGCCIWFDDEEMPSMARTVRGAVIPDNVAPEVVQMPPVDAVAFERLVAAGGGPVNPPREWFSTPEPDHYQPVEVSADGHWTGHIARKGQCYLGSLQCRTAPESKSTPPYKAFHRTTARCADGSQIACGWVTMDTKHAPELHNVSPGQVADQYDHTGTLGAKIRCSNGKHGVWSSGALLPGLPERALAILQGPEVSGDWRHWTDPDTGQQCPLELLGVLGVPFPAFPGTRTRPELLVASGGIIGQRGHILPCDEGDPMNEQERAEFAALTARVDELTRQNTVLIAAAGPEVAAALAAPPVEGAPAEFAAGVTEGIAASAGNIEDVSSGIADGIAEVAAAVETEAAAQGETIDLSQRLTGGELAAYYSRHDDRTRSLAAADGRAMPDGSLIIEDADDLFAAARLWDGDPRVRAHLERNAARLGRTDITFGTDVMFARYTVEQLREFQAEGRAMPSLSRSGAPRFAIGDADDLARAIPLADSADVRRFLISVATDADVTAMLPESWQPDGTLATIDA